MFPRGTNIIRWRGAGDAEAGIRALNVGTSQPGGFAGVAREGTQCRPPDLVGKGSGRRCKSRDGAAAVCRVLF